MEFRDVKDPRYIEWRSKVFRRDRWTCQFPSCQIKGGHLNAHHIKTWAAWPSLRFVVSNGITLCKGCHDRVFGREQEFEATFSELVAQMKKNKPQLTKADRKRKEKIDLKVLDIWFKNI